MANRIRVAYTLEQCWHDVPGGTAIASLELARTLLAGGEVDLVGVAGRHRRPPHPSVQPPLAVHALPLARPWLYETWNRVGWPRVDRATGPIDVCHSTLAIPAATRAPHVVTVHDIAFVHHPERFTGHGARVMRAGLERCRRADLVVCPSAATRAELAAHGFDAGRLRVVPWGVRRPGTTAAEVAAVRDRFALPDRFVLFVGTLEPRKNLARLAAATREVGVPLVVAGAPGWGEQPAVTDATFLGFVPPTELAPLYAAASVFAYPSLHEGFGLPVAEAMAAGTPVVTSRGTATEEVAGGAAVLVDPTEVASIAAGIDAALARGGELRESGLRRAGELSWERCAERHVELYRELAGSNR